MLSATSRCVCWGARNHNLSTSMHNLYCLVRTVATLSFAKYDNHGTRNVLFLHGIMGFCESNSLCVGNKRNWGNFVKL